MFETSLTLEARKKYRPKMFERIQPKKFERFSIQEIRKIFDLSSLAGTDEELIGSGICPWVTRNSPEVTDNSPGVVRELSESSPCRLLTR